MIYVPFGDHCTSGLILRDLEKRNFSFPYDWCVHKEQMYETNLYTLIDTTVSLFNKESEEVAKEFLGNFNTNQNINSSNNIWFAHEHNQSYDDVLKKYTKRFDRLKNIIKSETCCLVSIVRLHQIDVEIMKSFKDILKDINKNNNIMIISGVDQSLDFKNIDINFQYIEYKFSGNFGHDPIYRENIKRFFAEKII
jgi:hypothetical protein